ncbi:bestrophin-2-like [Daphnia carinata]|uniref:bestrophin-2-like n=1 Tax=Daphnia carinata TaxID=120202 RepID=UPI00257BF2D6|nr:bestrophin-2-like [Daphnia carinata]
MKVFGSQSKNCGIFDCFKSVFPLFKWRSSLYKLCYKELILLLIPYLTLTVVYRCALNEDEKRLFEELVRYFERYLEMISLPFILGFYVATVAARWWQQYMALPWPDRLILTVAAYIGGTDSESRKLKKTLVRHCNLMAVLLIRSLSTSASNRKKTLEDAVKSGFMTKTEMRCYESIESDVSLYWLPGLWFAQNLQEAFMKGHIKDTYAVNLIMEELLDFRGKCGTLWTYSWISIPLIYTQVVTLAVYSFFFACIMGHQRIVEHTSPEDGLTADLYYGFSLVLKFFFYMGLLKLAEQMICPYGDGDEHFDVDFLLNRHAQVIQLGTDTLSEQCPSASHELLNQEEYSLQEEDPDADKGLKNKRTDCPYGSTATRKFSALKNLRRTARVSLLNGTAAVPFFINSDATLRSVQQHEHDNPPHSFSEISTTFKMPIQNGAEQGFARYWKNPTGMCKISPKRTHAETSDITQSSVHL